MPENRVRGCGARAEALARRGGPLAVMLSACAWMLALPPAFADVPLRAALGKPVPSDEVARWDLTVYADGRGLPAGRGTVVEGLVVYERRCAACHGERGTGGSGGHLVGRGPLTGPDADRTVGSYWPFATTLFDFVRRSMPMDAPGSLTTDEIFAVTAYLLHENRIVAADAAMDAKTLPRVRMPNRNGFVGIDVPWPVSGGRQSRIPANSKHPD